jgi:phosphoglycolate phosphatase
VMIGDTSFDMLMAGAAGVRGLGVGWGYHAPEELHVAGAASVAMDSAELARHIGLP